MEGGDDGLGWLESSSGCGIEFETISPSRSSFESSCLVFGDSVLKLASAYRSLKRRKRR